MNVLEFKRVGFGYPGQTLILSGVNLSLASGERAIVLGSNGSGKSTIAFLAGGLLTPQKGEIFRNSRHQQRLRLGIVFQNSRLQMIGTTVEEDLAFGLSVLNYSPRQIRAKVDDFLQRFGLEEKRYFGSSQLSGGELRRLALAAVLIAEPEVLILDEPLGMLDSYHQAVFLYYLQHQISDQVAVLWLDHDLRNIRHCNRYYLLKETQLNLVGLTELNNSLLLKEVGLEPAPLQPLEWQFPTRISNSIYGPEQIQFDKCES
ncbi:MAG TPA: ABC transporter ATP-binding protein [Bacillota bacterium]|nr:ABC transporter ATP-binding protein [Bacillota bacterium]